MTIATADAAALVRLPHVTDHDRDIEIEIDDHRVMVGYPPERVIVHEPRRGAAIRRDALRGRVELEITHGPLWTTMRSYRDGQTDPVPPHPHAVAVAATAHRTARAVGFGAELVGLDA